MIRRSFLTAMLFTFGLSAQESPKVFELWLPDFFENPFRGGNSLIELPDRPIQRLTILVRDTERRNLKQGRYRLFVNGKGVGNVFEERTVSDGTLLVMDPQTLHKRPDQVFDAHENAIEVLAEDIRGRIYYQNWILRVNSSQQNAMFGYSSVLAPDDPKGVPPDLIVTEPSTPPVFRSGEPTGVRIKGRISSGARLTVDGQPVALGRQAAIIPFEYSATASPGQREIVLLAADARGNTREVRIPVFGPSADLPRISFNGQRYAVVIGISNFGSGAAAAPPLPLAAIDAEEFASTLTKRAGFKRENIRLLTNERATLESIRVALTEFVAKAQVNDILLVYFATHGLHDPRPNRGERLFLSLYGTQLATLDSTALSLSDLEINLNRSVRTNQAFILFDVGHELTEDWRFRSGRSLVNAHVLSLFSDKPGWSILVSGSPGETTGEHKQPGLSASIFGYWLSLGLSGAADLNGDHVITAKELFAYVSENVKLESAGNQQPRFRLPEKGASQPLGTHSPPEKSAPLQ